MYAVLSLTEPTKANPFVPEFIAELGFYKSLEQAKKGLAVWVNHLFPELPKAVPCEFCCRNNTIIFVQLLSGALPGLIEIGYVKIQAFTEEETQKLNEDFSGEIDYIRPVQIGEEMKIETTINCKLIGYEPDGRPMVHIEFEPEQEFESWTMNGKPVFALRDGKIAVNDEPED